MAATEMRSGSGRRDLWATAAISLLAAVAFYLSTNPTQNPFDYTARIASAMLHGHLGLKTPPPSWLNEMVPQGGAYYSVFPVGAVLSVTPVAILQEIGLVASFPARLVTAVLAGLCVGFFFGLCRSINCSPGRRILLALFPIFATWAWCDLGFGGAWHVALGFALLGQAAALYFTLVRPRPLWAGAFFALAFGNRTELLLTLPIYLYLWLPPRTESSPVLNGVITRVRSNLPALVRFLAVPAGLALLTAAYNFARFHSIFDFGYSHIPNLLQEPWYQHGLFSIHAIPWNMHKMLFEGFEDIPDFPYLLPHAFGASIFLASPFLFLLFRQGGKHRVASWTAIGLLTFVLWCHGNPGGWQFSYRYAIVLLPWFFLLVLENGSGSLSVAEVVLFVVSVAINAMATYLFLWTNRIHV
jgi:hypothetical protein